MSDEENEVRELKRLIQTGENTYYVDTGSLKNSGSENNDAVAEEDAEETDLNILEKLTGKKKSKVKLTGYKTQESNSEEYFTKYEDRDTKLDELEQSLINYLSQKRDIENLVTGGFRRIRSLKFNIVVKETNAFFTVQIGVCEASFIVENGLKEKGSCFGIEKYIREWYERGSTGQEIKKFVDMKRTQMIKKERKG